MRIRPGSDGSTDSPDNSSAGDGGSESDDSSSNYEDDDDDDSSTATTSIPSSDDNRQLQEQFDDRVTDSPDDESSDIADSGGSSSDDTSEPERSQPDSNDPRQLQEQFDDRVTDSPDSSSDDAPNNTQTDDLRQQQERFDDRIGDDASAGGDDPITDEDRVNVSIGETVANQGKQFTRATVGGEQILLRGIADESDVRSAFRGDAANVPFSEDELVITGVTRTDDGLSATVEPESDAQRRVAREQAAAEFESELDREIQDSDIILNTGTGEAQLAPSIQEDVVTEDVATETGTDQDDVDAIFDGFDLVGVDVDPQDPTASNTVRSRLAAGPRQADDNAASAPLQPQNEPGTAATAVGGFAQAVANSPIGSAVDVAADPFIGDADNRSDGLVGEIDQALADIEQGFDAQITDRFENTDPNTLDANTFGIPRPFGVTGGDAQQILVDFGTFANPGSIGRDIITVGDGVIRTGAFLAERGPEGAQIAGEVGSSLARQSPSAAQNALANIAENPRESARTATALTATFGAGAAASATTRAGASVASRGARQAASRADDVVDVARNSGRSVRTRAPDVSVRQDPDSGIVEIDPMLQQQLRNVARGSDEITTGNAGTSGSLAREIGRRTELAQVNARLNADAAVSRLQSSVPDRSSFSPDISTDVGSAARSAGRRSRQAELNAQLEAAAAASRLRNAVPSRDSLPVADVFDEGSDSLARQAGRRFESERQGLRLAASAAPSAVRSRVSSAVPDVDEIIPSRPGSLNFSDSPASIARRAGRRFESERRSLELTAAAAPSAVRSRTSDAANSAVESVRSAASAPSRALSGLDRSAFGFDRPSLDFDTSFSVRRPDRRLRDAVAGVRDTTIRVGPARPARTDIEVGDFDIEFDEFDDEIGFGLDDTSGAGGQSDFGADVDVGGGGDGAGGSAQLSAMRVGRQADSQVDLDPLSGASEAAERAGFTGRDILSGIGAIGAGSFDFASDTGTSAGDVLGPQLDPFAGTSLSNSSVSTTETTSDIAGDFGVTGPTPTVSTPTTTSTATSTVSTPTVTTTQMGTFETTGTGRPTDRPKIPKAPDFEFDSPDREDTSRGTNTGLNDDVFSTGVKAAEDALDDLF